MCVCLRQCVPVGTKLGVQHVGSIDQQIISYFVLPHLPAAIHCFLYGAGHLVTTTFSQWPNSARVQMWAPNLFTTSVAPLLRERHLWKPRNVYILVLFCVQGPWMTSWWVYSPKSWVLVMWIACQIRQFYSGGQIVLFGRQFTWWAPMGLENKPDQFERILSDRSYKLCCAWRELRSLQCKPESVMNCWVTVQEKKLELWFYSSRFLLSSVPMFCTVVCMLIS